MIRILVSQCLYGGAPVRYDGRSKAETDPLFLKWKKEGRLIPFCPETAGGLTVPRPPAQIRGERVITETGIDVTYNYMKGAEAALRIARQNDVGFAILKQKSPSCGSSHIYDGTFTGKLINGRGIAAEHLAKAGIKVFGDNELKTAKAYLEMLQKTSKNR